MQRECNLRFRGRNAASKQLIIKLVAVISQIFFGIKLHVSDSSSVHHQEFFTVHTAVVYVILVCCLLKTRIRPKPVPDYFCTYVTLSYLRKSLASEYLSITIGDPLNFCLVKSSVCCHSNIVRNQKTFLWPH